MFWGILSMVLVGTSWTVYGIVMGKAPKQEIDVSRLLFLSTLLAALISLAAGLAEGFPRTSAEASLLIFLSLAACGICNYYQLDVMSKAMQKGPNGIIWCVCQSGFIFPFFMGVVFFREPLNFFQGTGFFVMLVSLVLFGRCQNNDSAGGNWKFLTLLAFLITGCSQSLQSLPSYFLGVKEFSPVWRTCIYSFGMTAGAVTACRKEPKTELIRKQKQLMNKQFWIYLGILETVEVLVSFFLLFPGLDKLAELRIGAVAFPIMVSSCLIAFELYSLLILREKHKLLQWIALALCMAGIILLSVKP